ncbi:MAG: epoxyqueuosine reductase QueH [Lachnospiraceae bacterium]|nr:epoxyqueuosine reductase QueH [Lachnospiraceae bacterium]
MNAVRNYQKELDKIIEQISELPGEGVQDISVPTLFLHSCCAPCSSYVLEYLRTFFRITVFFYNPNITEDTEYRKRMEEQKRLIACYNESLTSQSQEISAQGYPIGIVEGDYDPDCFYRIAKGLEKCPEGGERCFGCYALRLKETVSRAAAGGYDYFTTTLTISPLKNAARLNEIGEALAKEYGVDWLPSDFKKRGGYQRSIALSKEYDLYRQDYCGCIYSYKQRHGML